MITLSVKYCRGLKFYYRRLRAASIAELAHRIRQGLLVLRLRYIRGTWGVPFSVPDLRAVDIDALRLPSLLFETDGEAPEQTSKEPAVSPAPSDIRSIWEPARLQHATLLFALASERKNPVAHDLIDSGLETVRAWIEDNPFPYGPHYMSAMECALRIPVFTYCLKYCVNRAPHLWPQIVRTIYSHAWWISRRLSLYSSRGNHTICEAAGLVFAGQVFINHDEGRRWLAAGLDLLYGEALHQILEDGGPAEQAFQYHRFVLDIYWLALDFIEANGFGRCVVLRERLIRAESFLAAFQDQNGNLPSIGDSDDGRAVAPRMMPRRESAKSAEGPVKVFEHSGYTVIHAENGAVLTFDHGPLGMPPFCNHGHADALSITLSKQGEPILVDPGTYRYNGDPCFRRYFKSTRAHNTVTVDGLDQADQVTGFIWGHPFSCELIGASACGDGFIVEAVHDGYSRLAGAQVYHRRKILFFGGLNFLCRDTFTGSGDHEFEINFHLHPDSLISLHERWWEIGKGAEQVFLMFRGGQDFTVVRGKEDPLFGWFSPSYGVKRKSPVLCSQKRGLPGEIAFTTIICTGGIIGRDQIEEAAGRI